MTVDPRQAVVLALDLGTSALKVAYVTLDGEVRATAHRDLDTRFLPHGRAVQDARNWWQQIVAAGREIAAREPEQAARVSAIACTGQWGSTVPVDKAGRTTGDALLWLDQRGGPLAAAQLGGRIQIGGYRPRVMAEWIRRAGGGPSPEGNDPLGHRLWIQHQEPAVFARTAVFMEPIDYVNLRLCGRVAATQASMTLSWLTDNRRLDARTYDPVLTRLAGADVNRLPPLRPIRSVIGGLTARSASELEIPTGTPVVSALPDLHASTLGSGAVAPLQGHISLGTSAWIGVHVPKKKTSIKYQMATVPSAMENLYVLVNNHDSAGSAMTWLRNEVVAPEDGLTRGNPSLAELDAVAAEVPPGAGGVRFQPWLKGLRSPVRDAEVRAGFSNLGLESTRAELIRAVLEGVAHQMRWMTDASEKVVGTALPALRIIGGGAQSDVWCQIHADVIGRPLHRVADPLHANVRGAALFAGIVTGLIGSDEVGQRVPVEKVFAPEPRVARLYAARHAEFLKAAASQRKMYRRVGPRQ